MNREKLEQIELFVNGSLTLEERNNFQREVNENPELSETVNKFMFAKDIIVSANTRKEVAMVHQDFMTNDYQSQAPVEVQKPAIKKLFWTNTIRIAASIVLIIGAFAAYQARTLNPESFIADNEIEYTSSTFRGAKSDMGNVRGLYRTKNYEQVLSVLQNEPSPNAEMIFLKAMANYKLKNYRNALSEFERLRAENARTSEPSFVHELAYYEALSLVGFEEYERAIQSLEKVKNDPNNPYSVGISEWQLFKLKLMK
jgi:tetratricopeptide (TPR) repeat protein